jgi:ketosteroid isomerase-like protein
MGGINLLPYLNDIATYARAFDTGSTLPFDAVGLLDDAFQKFLAGDVGSLLDLESDDVVTEVTGPAGLGLHFGTYQGKDGFMQFCLNAYGLFDVTQFRPHYYLVTGHTVNVVLTESFRWKETGGTDTAEFIEQFVFDDAGKVKFINIIQDSFVEVLAVHAGEGYHYSIPYPNTDYTVSNFAFPDLYTRIVGLLAVDAISHGRAGELNLLVNRDFQLVMGNEVAPWGGIYIGHQGVADVLSKLALESPTFAVESVVGQGNKAVVNLRMRGTAPTGIPYESAAKFLFQLAANGRIARGYFFYDQYSTYHAHNPS